MVEVNYKMKNETQKIDYKTNIYIASFTTAMARLKLYNEDIITVVETYWLSQ